MIQANELRIGNWVKYKGTHHQVWRIDTTETIKTSAEPIPLTEEILLKCDIKYFELRKFQDGYSVLENLHCITEVKYLHELQNLCYAIYKEELKIEL